MKHITSMSLPWLCKMTLATTLYTAAFSQLALTQVPSPSLLRIDTQNVVLYVEDTGDVSQFATNPSVPNEASVKNFFRAAAIADIVAVNGQPVTGTHTRAAVNFGLRTAPTPGLAISDTMRSAVATFTFEILKSDGTPIGTIIATGLAGGTAPPGSSLAATGGNNLVIAGGTGAFLGARGQVAAVAVPTGVTAQRPASMTEDPANRRVHGGGSQRWVVHLIPMSVPQVVATATGPVVFHSDFSPVTSAKPAKAGEVLIVQATGLGPTVPAVEPGQPFPDQPVQVNSPIDVAVNGTPAEVISSVGWPGLVDTFRIDIRVPGGGAPGLASLQISAAWITGPELRIPIQ